MLLLVFLWFSIIMHLLKPTVMLLFADNKRLDDSC